MSVLGLIIIRDESVGKQNYKLELELMMQGGPNVRLTFKGLASYFIANEYSALWLYCLLETTQHHDETLRIRD